jgi:hypothetical protein
MVPNRRLQVVVRAMTLTSRVMVMGGCEIMELMVVRPHPVHRVFGSCAWSRHQTEVRLEWSRLDQVVYA